MADRDDQRNASSAGDDPHRDLAGVLHDVSNALTVLLGWVGEARAPGATPETIASALTIIEQRARIARDLARQAIGGGRVDEERALGSVVIEVVEALRVEAARAGITLTTSGGDTTSIVAGAFDVSEILTNLLLNAIAHAPKGSEVTVETAYEAARCAVLVCDRGPGVPEDRRDAIFEGASLRAGGAGVGLRHSRNLARARGGDVELLAPAPPYGARFRLTWPLGGASAAKRSVPRIPIAEASSPALTVREPAITRRRGREVRELEGRRILVLEDDDAVVLLLETALEARGAAVTIAASTAELTTALEAAPYDAALVDLSPIAHDPAAALARLRASSPDLDLVLITGSADRLPDAVATENIVLVRKPFELPEVLAALAKKSS